MGKGLIYEWIEFPDGLVEAALQAGLFSRATRELVCWAELRHIHWSYVWREMEAAEAMREGEHRSRGGIPVVQGG